MHRFKALPILAGAAALGAITLTAGPAAADTIYDFEGSNGTVSATAEFDFSTANMFTLKLTNTTTTINDNAKVLTDFQYTFSSAPTILTLGSITAPHGIDCTGNGSLTTCTENSTTSFTGDWTSTLTSATDLLKAGPSGQLHPDGIVNNSILGCGANNCDGLATQQPYIEGPATFAFDTGSSFLAVPTISNVTFSFGTAPETVLGVPAPAIGHGLFVLLAIGGVLAGGKLLENRKKHFQAA